MEERLRFSGFDWFPEPGNRPKILIAGAGGIGSWTAFFLARIGYLVKIIDFDTVETHNLSGQLFRTEDIGKRKVSAVKQLTQTFCNTSIATSVDSVDDDYIIDTPYVVSAFDNMQARENLFNAFVTYCEITEEIVSNHLEENDGQMIDRGLSSRPIFIDGRLEGEQLQIYCVRGNTEDIEKYRQTLFSDGDVEEAPCSFKQTSHNACLIASLITSLFTNNFSNEVIGIDVRYIPFKTEFYIPNFKMDQYDR